MGYEVIYNQKTTCRKMRIATFMSGSGTNAVKVIENQTNYEVVLVFTDNPKSNAETIAGVNNLPYVQNSRKSFLNGRKIDDELREEFDRQNRTLIESYKVDLIALCGYMSIVSAPLRERYGCRIINVHPADLSIEIDGKRRFTGMHAVRDAILAGQQKLYSTTHIAREIPDGGEKLIRSLPVEVKLPEDVTLQDLQDPENEKKLDEIVENHQNKLKERGDWIIFPLTLRMIAAGRYGIDNVGGVYVDDMFMPNSYRLDEISGTKNRSNALA